MKKIILVLSTIFIIASCSFTSKKTGSNNNIDLKTQNKKTVKKIIIRSPQVKISENDIVDNEKIETPVKNVTEKAGSHISGTYTPPPLLEKKPEKSVAAESKTIKNKPPEKTIHVSGSTTVLKENNNKKEISVKAEKVKTTEKKVAKKKALLKGKTITFPTKMIAGEEQKPIKTLEEGKAKFAVLNFHNANIRDVILTISNLLKINYILDPAISGNVSIHTSQKIPIEDVYPIFQQILALNGVSLIKKGKLYWFVPAKEILRQPVETYIGRDKSFVPDEEKMIFQIIPIDYLPIPTLQGILMPLLTKNGVLLNVPGPNRLFIVESASNIRRLLDIINALDVNMFDEIQVKLYEIKHAESSNIIEDLEQIFSTMGYGGGENSQVLQFIDLPRLKSILVINTLPKLFPNIEYWINKLDISLQHIEVKLLPVKYAGGKDIGKLVGELQRVFSALGYGKKRGKKKGKGENNILNFVPISRLNSILVINSYSDLFPKILKWLDKFDQPQTGEGASKVYVYYVQHSDAGNIASILNQLFAKKWRKNPKKVRQEKNNKSEEYAKKDSKSEKNVGKDKKISEPVPSDTGSGNFTLNADVEGDISIIADATTNSLIIRTSPRNYPVIIETIKKLDIMPMQVMIEVIIAEIQLDDGMKYGVDWAMREKGATEYGVASSVSGTVTNPAQLAFNVPGAQGVSLFINKSDKLLAMLKAFSNESKLEVLSSPLLLASENQAASIDIVTQIPIRTDTTDIATGAVHTTFEYKDVGIKLNVLPKISREKYLSLDISQEVSQVTAKTNEGQPPGIFSRRTETSVVIKDKQTLVIAGLMEKRSTKLASGVPGLFNLPFLGCFFGLKDNGMRKTELLVFITPHIISNTEEANDLTEDYKKRLKMLNVVLKKGYK